MLDLIAEGYELWERVEPAESADSAGSPQRQGLRPVESVGISCGKQEALDKTQLIRTPPAFPKAPRYGPSADSADSASPVSVEECLWWIRGVCPLLPEDLEYISRQLAALDQKRVPTAALWYINAWHRAAAAEPEARKKESAGRYAANSVLSSERPAPLPDFTRGLRREPDKPRVLKEGQRMAWTIVLDGKCFSMLGQAMSYQQALEAAQARWPKATVKK